MSEVKNPLRPDKSAGTGYWMSNPIYFQWDASIFEKRQFGSKHDRTAPPATTKLLMSILANMLSVRLLKFSVNSAFDTIQVGAYACLSISGMLVIHAAAEGALRSLSNTLIAYASMSSIGSLLASLQRISSSLSWMLVYSTRKASNRSKVLRLCGQNRGLR
uniref:Uncharacterized protein n=1 Tax=Spironucleus salmonicida TaxID=348837 RepID=V6LEY7_9EUKA|eukprot:EST43062.1 Hypothetical protein SS50377_17365 [Spironucleus salmonicida]